MSAPPFINPYNLRTVADSDAKSCYVCYKPSNKVLISDNKVDFFYICPSHLKDSSFATPIHSDDYQDLVKQKANLVIKIAEIEAELKNLGYNWDFVSKIPGFSKKPEKSAEGEAKSDLELPKIPTKTSKSLNEDLTKAKSSMDEISETILKFSFKQFNLDKDIYRNRVRAFLQVKANQKRQQELQKPGFFPSAPTHDIQ